MRGKQGEPKKEHYHVRITPADAGKTKVKPEWVDVIRDHPRGCGENHSPIMTVAEQIGSPPRMRGKPVIYQAAQAPPRITPADAGKTGRYALKLLRYLGSPPRMRGKHRIRVYSNTIVRITPADAGKTFKFWNGFRSM